VLTLLYDKTFPPKQPNSHQVPAFEPQSRLMRGSESMGQFSYAKKMPEKDEDDEQKLEREIG